MLDPSRCDNQAFPSRYQLDRQLADDVDRLVSSGIESLGFGATRCEELHWNRQELEERSRPLRDAGHKVLAHWSTEIVAKLGDFVPDVVVISLDRLPSHGRAYAGWIWEAKKRRSTPIMFAGGQADKVLVTKHQFPRGIFCASHEVPDIVARLLETRTD